MLMIAGKDRENCPYRNCLGVDTADGRISWYQLLAVAPDATHHQLLHRWNQRRTLAIQKRMDSGNPVWDSILDELDRALACLSHPRKKVEYDLDLSRRRRQASIIHPQGCSVVPRQNLTDAPDSLEANTSSPVAGRYESSVNTADSNSTAESDARRRFEPLRVLGRGQNGTRVFEAYEFTLGRTVAVKCLEKSCRSESRCRSFLDEARFLASISHPNLLEVHTVNERSVSFAMEFLGQTVREHFKVGRNGECQPAQVSEFLEQSLSVLQCLHEKGVVHGAISLKSFLVTDSGVIKLVDAPGCTGTGLFRAPAPDQICVAPELLSPESFGEPKATVDLYMLGYVAVELLAGDRLPKWFRKISSSDSADQQQWLRWHASPFEKLPSLEQLVPGLSESLAGVIEKLCHL